MKTSRSAGMNLAITPVLTLLIIPVLIMLTGCSSLQKREARQVAGVDRARPIVEGWAEREARYVAVVDRARPYVAGRQDYDLALRYLNQLQTMCARFAEDSHSSAQENEQWQERVEYIQKCRQLIVSQYDTALRQVRTRVNDRQTEFVRSQAVKDLKIAQSIADGQNGKWFNWFGLRDDATEWAKAAVLCDLVLGDARIGHILSLAAARQKQECEQRLGSKGRRIYANLHALPGYHTRDGFPAVSEEEITGHAKKIWCQTETPQPLFEEDSSDTVPAIGMGFETTISSAQIFP